MFRDLFHILQVLARVSFLNLMVYLFSLQCKYPLLVIVPRVLEFICAKFDENPRKDS
jgi:hypothetical protein